ncbi:somatostatin 6 [Brachyhypopomus gauderio]|uniref:somatostatin 6 n=1 Tax=Brachyhypopomus gauderio TaxID=698409 RepID=UPI0040422EC6
MRLGGRADPRGAGDGGTLVMKVLLGLVPVLLITWGTSGTAALPVQEKLPHSNEVLTKEYKELLLKVLTELAELNMTAKDLGAVDMEQLLSGKLGEKFMLGLSPAREKSPCKNFFWKTFSSC